MLNLFLEIHSQYLLRVGVRISMTHFLSVLESPAWNPTYCSLVSVCSHIDGLSPTIVYSSTLFSIRECLTQPWLLFICASEGIMQLVGRLHFVASKKKHVVIVLACMLNGSASRLMCVVGFELCFVEFRMCRVCAGVVTQLRPGQRRRHYPLLATIPSWPQLATIP